MNADLLDDFFEDIYNEILVSLEVGKGGPFGSGVVINDELIAIGTNEVLKSMDVSRHAEVVGLSKATQHLQEIHIPQAIMLSTHLPCLMCYHAIKWAKITKIYYIFGYEDTETLFSFQGDTNFLHDLKLSDNFFTKDSSVDYIHYQSDVIEDLYWKKLPMIWKEKYEAELSGYDV